MKHLIALAALGLMSALSVKSAEITITNLPYTITAPGVYILKSNLTFTGAGAAISTLDARFSSGGIPGPVVIDLKGFTIIGTPNVVNIGVSIPNNTYPITVRNGKFTGFQTGIRAYGVYIVKNITVENAVFDLDPTSPTTYQFVGTGVAFLGAENSTISNCKFYHAQYGIQDTGPIGGNAYSDDYFDGSCLVSLQVEPLVPFPITVHGILLPVTINRCRFAPVPANF